MKFFFWFIVALVLAGIVGTLMANDPGYVLVSWGGHTVQTGLWVFIALVLLAVLLIYYAVKLIRITLASGGIVSAWRGERQRRKAREQTAGGLMLLNEGAWDRAERQLKRSAGAADYAGINWLYAARAADRRGDVVTRDEHLDRAVASDRAVAQAVAVAGAEMDIDHGRYHEALDRLVGASDSDIVVRLKMQARIGLRDWQGVADLLSKWRKIVRDADEQFIVEKRIALARIEDSQTDEALAVVYKQLPEVVRHDPDVLSSYVRKLDSETEAESALREALNRHWMPSLLDLYGGLGEVTLSRRLKTAEGWLRHHADDPYLQNALGEMYEAKGDTEAARAAYRKSVDLNGPPAASRHLGRLLAFDGQYKESSELLSRALSDQGSHRGAE